MCMTTGETMSISDKLSKIKNRANSLNEQTDQLNATIGHIEKELQGTGVEFWWTDGPQFDPRIFNNDDGERIYAVLGYTKIGSEWRIAVQDHREESHETGTYLAGREDPVPLVRASRSIRISVAPELENFLDAFEAAVAAMEAKVEKANALVGGDEAQLDRASAADMKRLLQAIQSPDHYVEIKRHIGSPSANAALASESAAAAAQLNARGVRVATIFESDCGRGLPAQTRRQFECGVSAEQVRKLLAAGATER